MKPPTRILLADDHLVVRMGIATIISFETDMTVVGETDNGEGAVRLALELKPDVILMDIMMPKMSGVDATVEILKATPNAKILVLTTFGTSSDIKKILAAGAAGAMVKTSSQQEIINAIRTVAAGGRVVSKEIENNMRAEQPVPNLSTRQLEILGLVAKGFSNQDIARLVGIGVNGVKDHLKNIYSILEVSSRTEAATQAVNLGIISI
ncbi:MAG: response regulator transcription factor [Kiritimatiellae bacterium]|nr:response regulator transcription factor [Kiritimatiellia bacterium]MBQ3342182.1 response regulator transcription factor [Kiritimatiellia bacterium]